MPTEALKIFGEMRQALKQIQPRNAPCRAPERSVLLFRKQNGRPRKLFRDFSGGNAYRAGVPAFVFKDDNSIFGEVVGQKLFSRLDDHFVADGFTLVVVGGKLLKHPHYFRRTFGEVHTYDLRRVVYAPRGVQPRRNLKHNVGRLHFLKIKRLFPHAINDVGVRLIYSLQAVMNYNSVVGNERNDVGDGGGGGNAYVAHGFGDSCSGFDDFEHDASAAIVPENSLLRFRIHDYRVRDFVLRFVVVGDDDVDTLRFDVFDFFNRRYSAIDAYDEIGRETFYLRFKRRNRYSVTLLVAVRDIKADEIVGCGKKLQKHCNRANAVAIVVAVNENTIVVFSCPIYSFHGFADAVDFKRRLHVVKFGIEKFLHFFGCIHTSFAQKLGDFRANARAFLKIFDFRTLHFGSLDEFYCHNFCLCVTISLRKKLPNKVAGQHVCCVILRLLGND